MPWVFIGFIILVAVVSAVVQMLKSQQDELRRTNKGLLDGIRETGTFEKGTEADLEKAINAFKQQFDGSGKDNVPVGHEPEAGDLEHDVEHDKIVKQKH